LHPPELLTKLLPADPLRVLRAVRFASRYSFRLVDALREAAASDEVLICSALSKTG
jgi:tRNA nucleotidyltransferase/poly(A) polymerase